MEELHQEPETVIQQLRILLAAKEEELNELRGMTDSGDSSGPGESMADQLIEDLEEKKREAAELRECLKEMEAGAREKLCAMADDLEEKEKLIASLRNRSAASPEGESVPGENENTGKIKELEAKLSSERERMKQRLTELTGHLEEKGKLLEEMKEELDAAAVRNEAVRSTDDGNGAEMEYEILHLGDELTQARSTISELEAAAADEERAQAEVEQLRQEMEAAQQNIEKKKGLYEMEIAELQLQISSLEKERDEALSAAATHSYNDQEDAAERPLVEPEENITGLLSAREEELSAANSSLGSLRERVREIEEELELRERSYRTAQAQLHRLGLSHQVLKAVCVGLGVFLLFTLIIRVKRTDDIPPTGETAFSEPILLATSEVTPTEEAEEADAESQLREREPENQKSLDVEIFMLAGKKPNSSVKHDARDSADNEPRAAVKRIAYKVKKGDNLWLICQRELGDPGAIHEIAKDNNLTDPSALQVGDVIYLSQK